MSVTSDYVDFCCGLKYQDLPPEVVEYVKRLGLDFVGVAAYGTLDEASQVMLRFIRGLNAGGDCTVLGTAVRCVEQYAALANGTFVKGNELDDTEESSGLHPGAPVWPVMLALGERYHLDGKLLITAVVLGYETIIRLGQAINPWQHRTRGFHPSATCGNFAATVVAAKLLGLNRQQTSDALGITGSQTSGSFRYNVAGSWTKNFHSGWGAHNGILAAYLAREGFNAPSDIFEGQYGFLESYSQDTHPELIVKDLGKVYRTLRAGVKIHASCRGEHPGLDAILAIVRENDLKPEDIERVDLYVNRSCFLITVDPEDKKRAPQNVNEAMHSMYFGAAIAILRRRAFIEEHTETWLHSPQVRDLMSRVYCYRDVEFDKLLPEKYPARAVIRTKDGRQFDRLIEVPYGGGLSPLPLDELRAKYQTLAGAVFPEKQVSEIEEGIMHLETVRDFGGVATSLSARGGRV